MAEQVQAWKAADGTLFEVAEEADDHDAMNARDRKVDALSAVIGCFEGLGAAFINSPWMPSCVASGIIDHADEIIEALSGEKE